MRKTCQACGSDRLEDAVRVVCLTIDRRLRVNADCHWTEYALRRELVGCILGSRVRYETAKVMLEGIEQVGLLEDRWWQDNAGTFERQVFELLSGRHPGSSITQCYRFPKVRARQLTEARNAISRRSLSQRLEDASEARELRQQMVAEISGLGPKQASMFLRNIGRTYDLAILDAHVLRFMEMQQLLRLRHTRTGTLAAYERTEGILVKYASVLGYCVGYLDWAIWVTMRAVGELGQ